MNSVVNVSRPSQRLLYHFLSIFGGSLFLALMAQFSIPLWFTPVPITLQTLGVLLLGALLGSKRGSLAVLIYLAEGALGFPVFAEGKAGLAILFGPTGGYLFAFVFSAFIAGFLLERGWKASYPRRLLALSLSSLLTLGLGAFWLSFFVGAKNAIALGVYPFLIGCSLKVLAAATMIPSGWKVLRHFR